jgi:hypothetical protein
MLKKVLLLLVVVFFSGMHAQETKSLYQTKKISTEKDSIQIENDYLNSAYFKLLDSNLKPIDSSFYKINFERGLLLLKENFPFTSDSITVNYLKFPSFLTQEYQIYDAKRLVSTDVSGEKLYKIENNAFKKNIPFDGLITSGSITRGVTVGNNQNSVLNSNLDLQISGKLSEKVSLRASLQDSNIPLQDGGYSQKLDQFDNVFMELYSNKWAIRAGDIFLENKKTQFLNFNKKVQGITSNFEFGTDENKTTIFASASLVRGQYAKSNFVGREGDQGPYKLKGQNGELYVVVVSGSERVFVNGILLKRGENNDYTIDYNAGEIVFTPLYTISSEMRITVEYQYSDRNYTRFVTYAGGTHESKKWSFGSYLYSENDLKNQPLQQNLSTEQALVLANAGDNQGLMVAPSAFLDTYSENKILYKKIIINSIEVFENSNNPLDELYNVKFSLVGENKGDYVLKNSNSIAKIYEYIAPINSIPQGNYEPIIALVAPTKIQVATFLGKFNPNEKTIFDFEIGVSNNDQNLFSSKDDANNQGVATKINAKQRLFSKKWNVDAFANYQYVAKTFSTVERLYNIEFNRDWNLGTINSENQSYLVSGLQMTLPEKGNLVYQFEKLDFSKIFTGNRHVLNALLNLKNWNIQTTGSLLHSDGKDSSSKFLRNQTQVKYHFKKNWIGTNLKLEDNQEKNKTTNQLSVLSQRFLGYGFFAGRGDSTKVFVELGYFKRVNDSLQNQTIQRVNNSQNFSLRSKLIQTKKSDLSIFVNYRILDFVNTTKRKESSLNSRLIYNNRLFNQFIQSTTAFETNSGSIPQQEFTYLEVPVGQGVYTWNDYNNDGIQQLEEFEIAPFVDQAKYIRVFLPNQFYIKTHQNKFSQSIIINPNQWQNETGFKKILSNFYNQTSYIIDRKVENKGENFDLNPFSKSDENALGLNSSFRNSLFFNRGKQIHSVTYTYLQNKAKNLLSAGSQNAKNNSNQLQYNHLHLKTWLFGLFAKTIQTDLLSENYPEKNYEINGYQLAPKISYLFSKSTSWDVFYELQNKKNQFGNFEKLLQNRFGTSFSYAGKNSLTMNGEISFYQNKFTGNEFSSVGFQMLEGLQAGQNLTWRFILQKKLTQFLDVNFNYQGRKSESSTAIHTGNIQLRAFF